MKKFLFTTLVVAALTGCATNDYALYAEAQKAIAQSKAISDTARYTALAEIAKQGDTAAKIAAVMSIQAGSPVNSQPTTIATPRTPAETALQWTSVLLPNLTQIYSIGQNTRAALRQSDNALTLGVTQSNNQTSAISSTNQAFVGIAGKIQAPQANITTVTTDSSNRSTTTNTTTDSSNRSTTTNTTTDSSNRSTTTDSSNRSTTTNNSSNNTGATGP